MGLSEVYKSVGSGYTVNTAVYRFAVVSRVCGVQSDDELKYLSDEKYRKIQGRPMTETLERLLFLYGAGIVGFEVVEQLLNINKDVSDVLESAEEFLIKQYADYDGLRIPAKVIAKIIQCSAVLKNFADINAVSFDEAREIAAIPCVEIVDGYVKIKNIELFKLLLEIGEDFGYVSPAGDISEPEADITNILGNERVNAGDTASPEYPFMLRPKRIIYYERIRKQLYAADFLKYAVENNIPIDADIDEQYERYLRHIKCSFYINCYYRKRRICGDIYNRFDYLGNINNADLIADKSEKIEIHPITENTDEELISMALTEFSVKIPIQNETILEVHNQGKVNLFVFNDNRFIPLVQEELYKNLFDYGAIWGKIQEYVVDHNIKASNGAVEIPVELMEKFSEEEKPFAEALIAEQYSRQCENKGGNRVISNLLDLINNAKTEMERATKQKQLKQAQIKKHEEDMSKREDQIVVEDTE